MNGVNWYIEEELVHQRMAELAAVRIPDEQEEEDGAPATRGVRRTLAAKLVRLGLRLDPAAREDVGAPLDLAMQAEGGRAR